MKKRTLLFVITLAIVAAAPALAQEDLVQIHGFGGWSVGRTDANPYLSAAEEGENEWGNAEFALNVTANPTDKLTIVSQLRGELSDEAGDESGEVELEYGFAEWHFSDAAQLRFGLLKQPFGIYTEILDVGTLRPFYHLPQVIYGPNGFVANNLTGINITGSVAEHGRYDVYVGSLAVEVAEPYEEVEEEYDPEAAIKGEGEKDLEDVLGGRLIFETPVSGLSVGASAFGAKPAEVEGAEGDESAEASWGDFTSVGVQLEYLTDRVSLRAEAVRREETDESVKSFYIEWAKRFDDDHWQFAARYEWAEVDLDEELEAELKPLSEHTEWALGINYWFNPGLVLKLSYHNVDGNLLAHSEGDLAEQIEGGELEETSGVIIFGAQFSF